MRSRTLLVVAVLVLSAGCNAVPIGDESAPDGRETLTPVPVTDRTASATHSTPMAATPPGVSLNGSVDVDQLAAAHSEYIAETSYTWVLQYRMTGSTSGYFNRQFTRRVTVDDSQLLVEQFGPEQSSNQSLYATGETGYLRQETDNRSRYETVSPPFDDEDYAFASEAIHQFLHNIEFNVSVVKTDDKRFYRLHASGGRVPSTFNNRVTSVWNYSVTAYVTSDGFVRTMAVEYDQSQGNDGQHVSFRYDYSDLGTTDVRRPDWVSEAKQRLVATEIETPTGSPTPVTAANATAALKHLAAVGELR